MFCDLNIPWTANSVELQRTLAFSADLGYNVVAINHIIKGKLPSDLTSPIPNPLPFATPPGLRILRRCTLLISDPSQNHRLASLSSEYDILALRPTTEKALQHAIQSPEADLISLDLTQRFPFYFRPKQFSPALQRGLRVELNYGGGAAAGRGAAAAEPRRNLISNATSLIRVTRGRGLVLSSEARRALECRAPFDVTNLAAVWGLEPERAREAVTTQPRAVVAAAQARRQSYRGVVALLPASSPAQHNDSAKAHPSASETAAKDSEVSAMPMYVADVGAVAVPADPGDIKDVRKVKDNEPADEDDSMLPIAKRHRPQRPKRQRLSAQTKSKR